MKYKIQISRYKRLLYKATELDKVLLKSIKLKKKLIMFYFNLINLNSTNIKYKSILSEQSRSIYKFINLSRFKLKNYINKGLISVFKKINLCNT